MWRFGPFELYPSERRLRKSGVDVPLQPKTFDVLLMLVEKAHKLVSRQELSKLSGAGHTCRMPI